MGDAALIGLLVGLAVGYVAMLFDIFTDLDWEWSDAVVPIVAFPAIVSAASVVAYLVVRCTLLR